MSPTSRALAVTLSLLAVALPAAARAQGAPAGPEIEQLPPVDTGEDSVKGEYLDLQEPKEGAKVAKTVNIKITAKGIDPKFIELEAGKATKLVFKREVEETCATSLASQELNLDVKVPMDKPAEVIVTPTKKGDFLVKCPSGRTGMGVKVK